MTFSFENPSWTCRDRRVLQNPCAHKADSGSDVVKKRIRFGEYKNPKAKCYHHQNSSTIKATFIRYSPVFRVLQRLVSPHSLALFESLCNILDSANMFKMLAGIAYGIIFSQITFPLASAGMLEIGNPELCIRGCCCFKLNVHAADIIITDSPTTLSVGKASIPCCDTWCNSAGLSNATISEDILKDVNVADILEMPL